MTCIDQTQKTMFQSLAQTPELQAILAYDIHTMPRTQALLVNRYNRGRREEKASFLTTKTLWRYLLLCSTGPPGSCRRARLVVVPGKVSVVAEFSGSMSAI